MNKEDIVRLIRKSGKPSAGLDEALTKKVPDFSRTFNVGGRNRTRTCDPIDVNDVLYQLSHATMRDFYEVTSRYSPCGRIVKLIDVWEQVPEALQLRGFQAFRVDRQAIYSCLHTGVHRPLHTGVHDVCTRVCMAGCASHCP